MKRKPITVVSVDWDYFLPHCTDYYDWGHDENSFMFYEFIWPIRATNRGPKSLGLDRPAIESVRVDPERVRSFWKRTLGVSPWAVCIADSHKDIIPWLNGHGHLGQRRLNVINFDAHHDMGYAGTGKIRNLDCGNWVQYLRQQKRLASYTLVYPAWRKAHPEMAEGKTPDATRIIYGEWTDEPIESIYVFLCRSSCWMPSWCDDQWLSLRRTLLDYRPISKCEAPYVMQARPFAGPMEFKETANGTKMFEVNSRDWEDTAKQYEAV